MAFDTENLIAGAITVGSDMDPQDQLGNMADDMNALSQHAL